MNAELLQRVECGTTTVADAENIRLAYDRKMQIGGRIADAAMFFDTARAALAECDRAQAGQHVEHLHDAAQVLFGDRNAEMYAPEGIPFEQGKRYHAEFALVNHKDPLDLIHWRESRGIVNTAIVFETDGLRRAIFLCSPTELRLLAIALKQLADDAEDSTAQGMKSNEQEAA